MASFSSWMAQQFAGVGWGSVYCITTSKHAPLTSLRSNIYLANLSSNTFHGLRYITSGCTCAVCLFERFTIKNYLANINIRSRLGGSKTRLFFAVCYCSTQLYGGEPLLMRGTLSKQNSICYATKLKLNSEQKVVTPVSKADVIEGTTVPILDSYMTNILLRKNHWDSCTTLGKTGWGSSK